MQPRLIEILPVGNILGECVLWDDMQEAVWWTDIHSRMLYRYRIGPQILDKWCTPERLCSFGFVDGDERLIAAFENGFAFYNPSNGDVQWLAKPEENITGTRFNDGRVDRQGRFWSGTVVEAEEARDNNGNPATASLYCLEGDGSVHCHEKNIQISNSLCWSIDGGKMYFADSPTQTIQVYDFDASSGTPENKQVFVQMQGNAFPDGSTIDRDGGLWNAAWGAGEVIRFTPDGQKDISLQLPVSQPTCVALGGPKMNLLFVTTARENLSETELAKQGDAGNLFIFETKLTGVKENRFIVQ